MIRESLIATREDEIARCLFNESNDALFIFDPLDHRVVDLNPVALRMTGFPRRTAARMRVWDLFTSPDPRTLEQLIEAYKISWFYHSREGIYLNRTQGGPIPVNVSVSRIHTQPNPLGLVVARDISDRKRAEETLDRFFRLAPDLLAVLKPEGGRWRFVRLNPAWSNFLGYSFEDLMDKSLHELSHDADQDLISEALQRLVAGQEVRGVEVRFRHRDGSYRWLALSATLEDGVVNIVARDVTESRRAMALRRAIEEASLASQAKSDFVMALGHDIRTPLTAIQEYTTKLLRDPDFLTSNPAPAHDIQTIHRNAAHLLDLLGDLLELGRMDTAAFSIHPEACSLDEILDEILELMQAWAETKRLRLVREKSRTESDIVHTDRTRLRQILINLLSNAIKFTESGSVELSAWTSRGADASDPIHLHIAVKDTGPGMDPETLKRVFLPYTRAKKTGPVEGTGLGLSISHRLARLLGGQIDGESQPGVGSTFTLTVPMRMAEPKAESRSTQQVGLVQSSVEIENTSVSCRILVAEDHPDIRAALVYRLKQLGATVVTAQNGREAVDTVMETNTSGERFDVIVMDMLMPLVDGYEAARALRSLGCQVPIIALTAFTDSEELELCRAAGCNAHVGKPIDWSLLTALILKLERCQQA